MSEARFLVAVANGVMTLTFNRPNVGNALDVDSFSQWQKHLDAAAKDPSVLAVIITGSGQHFSTGADVKSMAPAIAEAGGMNDVLRNGSGRVTTLMIDFPKYIVAAVNGPVAGYPAGLLGLFDAVYVSDAASYSMPFLQLGIVPEACSSYTLPRTVGVATANDILLSGRTLTSAELVSTRIAAKVFPAATFATAVRALVEQQVAGCAESSILHTKRLLRPKALRVALHAVNEDETSTVISQFASGVPLERFMAVQQRLRARRRQGQSKSKL